MGGAQSLDKNIEFESNKNANANIVIEYCGSWGYYSYADDIRNLIVKFYPNAQFDLKKIPGYSGCLEVIVQGKLVHSKKNGEGYPKDSKDLMEKVKKAIEG